MNDIEILEEYIKELNKNKKKHELAYSTSFGKYWSDFGKAIENLIQRNKDLEQILELTSKSLDNISYDQIPIAIEELKFKLQDLEQIEKEHKEENGRLRDSIKELEKQYKILEVEKLRYNIQCLESDISQTPDTAMVYYSMKNCLETLREEKIKLETELQELLEESEK